MTLVALLDLSTVNDENRSADNIHSSDLYDSDFEREPSFIQRIKRQKKIDADTNCNL
jgi:hypothetical protein